MRFSGILFAFLVTAFVAAEDVTLAPTDAVKNGNDQDALDAFLGQELENEAAENSKSVVDKLQPTEEEERFPEDEKEELPEEETPEDIDEGEDVDVVDEEETPEDEELELPGKEEEEEVVTKPPKKVDEDFEEPIGGETPEIPETPEEEDVDFVDEEEASEEEEEALEEEEEETEAKTEAPVESDPLIEEKPEDPGEDEGHIPLPFEDEIYTDAPTPLPQPRFTPYPTVYTKPSLRPVSPYVSTDDDPLKNDNDETFNDWGFNQETVDELEKDVEEMAHDTKVVIALSTVFGLMFFFAVFVAYQMLENPNGICASLCRITVAFWCGLTRCICWPCRKMCGCTGNSQSNRQDHMMLANDGHFTHDLELS